MWGIGGDVSQFAAEDIARMIAQQQVQQQMQQQAAAAQQRAAMEQARLQLDQRQFDQGVVEHGDRLGMQTQQLEETAADRRDRANRAGVSDMMDQRKMMDTEANDRAIDEIAAQMPDGSGRRVVNLRRRGVAVQSEDVETPPERTTREAGDLTRIGQEADVRARVSARYREPNTPQYREVETTDDAGNPVINYMTAEEVRAKGGVRGVPKTTAKAQGPATVDAILKEIEGLSTRINTGGMGPLTSVTGLMRRGAGAVNMDNDVAEYESLVKGFIPMVARAVGHTGVLTQQDVDSVRALFPKPGDNAELARSKIARVRSLLAQMQPTQGAASPTDTTSLDQVEYVRDPQTNRLVRKR